MKAVLLGNGSREGVLDGVKRLRPEIERVVEVVAADFANQLDLSGIDADVAIVFGGDGSILRAVHQLGSNQIPILAVNLGTLGFLASIDPDEVVPFLKSPDFDNFEVREQLMLLCSIWRKKSEKNDAAFLGSALRSCAFPSDWKAEADDRRCMGNYFVVNEVAIRGGFPFSILDIDLAVDGERVTTFRGDGLIVATPVGSTGHNFAAGGPILRNELDAVLITPLSPQTINFRPVVDSAFRVYELSAFSGEVFVVVDGVSRHKLSAEDCVVIRRAPFSFKMIRVPSNKYYRNLQRKLRWGVDSVTRKNKNKQ
ncbi:MAG: NAD(+)/NADH kinase [Thermoguttaceae bacterium]|nr:NAD(+)/NADH kinase [Thermoguttaceae bacterium]MBR5759269.1 NAD(+)/NADH kinase [Thermoguttaceae bacterium]